MAVIIFDFDGTIANSFDYSVNFLAKEAGIPPLNTEQKTALHGLSLFRIARRLGVPWFRLPTLLHKGRKHMGPALNKVEPFEDMPGVIRKLHAEGHELFILSTNTVRNMRKFLHHNELQTYFLEIYGGVGMFGKAPALRRLLREQHIETRNALYIGDELRDALAAQSIGLRIISVTWGFARADDLKAQKPTAMAHHPEDIMRTLEEL